MNHDHDRSWNGSVNGLAQGMRHLHIAGLGNDNMYSQNARTGGPRGYNGPTRFRETDPSAPAGSKMNPNGPMSKSQFAYNAVTFAPRPDAMIQEKKLGEKMDLLANLVVLKLPSNNLTVVQYNVEVFYNNRPVKKRDHATKYFWEIYQASRREFPPIEDFVFNDFNMMWSITTLREGEGKIYSDPRNHRRPWLWYKYTGPLTFGSVVPDTQDSSLMATLVDAIATARTRMPATNSAYTVFKKLTFLVQDKATELSLDDIALYNPFKWGTDARVGFSIAVKMNLRAGPSACFDLSHSLFNRPGYPLVRLLVEITQGVIEDADYEDSYHELIRHAHIDEKGLLRMDQILNKMTLHYSLRPVYSQAVAREPFVPPRNIPGARPVRTEKDFKYYILGRSAVDSMFELERENGPPRRISIAQYYLDRYNYALRYPNLPVVHKKPGANGNAVMYPMELVSYIVNPTRYIGFAPATLRAEMIKYTSYTPNQRRMLLQHIIEQKTIAGAQPIIDNEDSHMRRFDLSLEKEMLKCKGTLLPTPRISYGNSFVHDTEHTGEWEAIRNNPMRTVLEDGLLERKNTVGYPRKKRLIGSIILLDSPTYHGQSLTYNTDCYNRLMYAIEQAGQPVS